MGTDLAAPARAAQQRKAAIRALDDPHALGRAARIVREALRRNRLTLADLTGDEDTLADYGHRATHAPPGEAA